jgi:hypothetical protein
MRPRRCFPPQCRGAVTATQAQKAVPENVALRGRRRTHLHKLRQVGPGSGFDLGAVDRGVLLHQAVQRGLLGVVTLVTWTGAPSGARWAC